MYSSIFKKRQILYSTSMDYNDMLEATEDLETYKRTEPRQGKIFLLQKCRRETDITYSTDTFII